HRANPCKATDDATSDSLSDWRSNRSQYSFDPAVVSGGLFFQVSFFRLFVRPALASSANMASQRVEVLPYKTDSNGPVCINFTVPVANLRPFLRINDLESAAFGTRGPEHMWGN